VTVTVRCQSQKPFKNWNLHMSDDADAMALDARALFRHLIDNLGGKPDTPYDWVFEFSHPDFQYLQSQMETIADFFARRLSLTPDDVIGSFDDAPTAEDEEGNTIELDPTMTLEYSGVVTEKTLAQLHKGFKRLAAKAKIKYSGVECY